MMNRPKLTPKHRSRGLLIGSAVLALALAVGFVAYRAVGDRAGNQRNPKYGIAAGSRLTQLSPTELNRDLDTVADLGGAWLRFDLDWSQIQPDGPETYDWSATDRIIEGAQRRGLKVLALLDYTPLWARPEACVQSEKCAPADPKQFASFATAAAKRYGSRVGAWEIWNEPNSASFWQPRADPVAYVDLLRVTSGAIKAVDPQATIVSGGLAPQPSNGQSLAPIEYARAMYAAGAKAYFDGFGFHPYSFPARPSYDSDHAWRQMAGTTNGLRAVMTAAGDSRKTVWMTEFGAPTGGPGATATRDDYNFDAQPWHVDEALQAATVADAVKLHQSYPWAGPLLWYTYRDAGTTFETNENFFGLVRADGTRKPAYDTFQKAVGTRR